MLSIPEYFENNDGYDHKWDDVTLFEPTPVRLWRGWNFDLSSRDPQLIGDIANATKITIGYRAKAFLEASEAGFGWPDVGTDDIFFSFAEMGHDKVIDHGPEYHGIWLHRVGAQLYETTTIADYDQLAMAPGLSYELKADQIVRKEWSGDCPCGDVAKHLNPVMAVLRIPELVRKGDLFFLPHPVVPGWYVTDCI